MEQILRFYTWLSENDVAILTGIVSSILVIFLQVVATSLSNTLYYFLTARLVLSKLFAFRNKESIYVVSGNKSHEIDGRSTALLMGPDASAANFIYSTLEQLYSESNIKHCYTKEGDHSGYNDENIVTVGGPVFNSFTSDIMSHLAFGVFFDNEDRLNFFDKIYEKSSTRAEDFGLIVKIRNPYCSPKKVIIVAGCGTHGCLAASFLFTKSRKFPKFRRQLYPFLGLRILRANTHFAAVISCKISGNDVSNVKIEDARVIR
jgi:hypothetical protein